MRCFCVVFVIVFFVTGDFVSQLIADGNAALHSGEKEVARRAFQTALRFDPLNNVAKAALESVAIKGILDINMGTTMLNLTVFVGDDPEAATRLFFKKYSLPMDGGSFIAVHNSVNAMLRGEAIPLDEDLQRSKVRGQALRREEMGGLPMESFSAVYEKTIEDSSGDAEVTKAENMKIKIEKQREIIEEMRRRLRRLERIAGPSFHSSQFFPKASDSYLTAPLPKTDSFGNWDWDEDIEAAQKLIFENQFPTDCSSRNALVFHFDRSYFGMAVNVHFLSVALVYGLIYNRVVVTKIPDHWNYAGTDCAAGWECYFRPISNCSESDFWEPYTTDIRQDFMKDYRGYIYQANTQGNRVLHYTNVDGVWQEVMHSLHVREHIPSPFRHRGLLWWRSQLTRFLFRPKDFVMDYIEGRRRKLGVNYGSVGLHVRHGDKSYDVIHQQSFFGPLSVYVSLAEKLARGEKDESYFVSTDDPSVIEEAERLNAHGFIKFDWDPFEKRFNGSHIFAPVGVSLSRWPGFPGNDPLVNTTEYALDSIKSVWFLANMHRFVGTVTSCFSRLVFQLRVASGKLEPTNDWTADKDPRFAPGWFVDP